MYSFPKGFQGFLLFPDFAIIPRHRQIIVFLTVFHHLSSTGDRLQGGGIPEMYSFPKGFQGFLLLPDFVLISRFRRIVVLLSVFDHFGLSR